MHLRLMGHAVRIVTQHSPRNLPRQEIIDETQVTRLTFLFPELAMLKKRQFVLWLAGLFYLPATLFQLYRLVRQFKPDVINFHYVGNPSLFVLILSYLYHVPLIVSLHGADVDAIPLEN